MLSSFAWRLLRRQGDHLPLTRLGNIDSADNGSTFVGLIFPMGSRISGAAGRRLMKPR
jgi:hypothetical protein